MLHLPPFWVFPAVDYRPHRGKLQAVASIPITEVWILLEDASVSPSADCSQVFASDYNRRIHVEVEDAAQVRSYCEGVFYNPSQPLRGGYHGSRRRRDMLPWTLGL